MPAPALLAAVVLFGAPVAPSPSAALLGAEPGHCRAVAQPVDTDAAPAFRQLGRLPRGHAEYAVLRRVDGCVVPAPVGFHPPAAQPTTPAPQ